MGNYEDLESKIWPIKIHRGKQPFDTISKKLVNVKVFGNSKGEGAFWEDLRWDTAIYLGMQYAEREYSGKFDFVQTEAYWPINHQVSPKEQTLKCIDCHTRSEEGRLAKLPGFYLPGRNYAKAVDYSGFAIIIISILGVIIHSVMRIFARKNNL